MIFTECLDCNLMVISWFTVEGPQLRSKMWDTSSLRGEVCDAGIFRRYLRAMPFICGHPVDHMCVSYVRCACARVEEAGENGQDVEPWSPGWRVNKVVFRDLQN